MLEVGKKAPAFNLPDQDGKKHKLSDYSGKWVLVYFYPRDNTSGCTKEACAIRDDWSDFKQLGAVVLGVSKDSVKSHRNFADKHSLPFTLLSDESTKMIEKYGAWRKKKMAGREYMGIIRSTFLIANGTIESAFYNVKATGHAERIVGVVTP